MDRQHFQSPPPAGGFGATSGPTAFGPMNGRAFQISSDRMAVTALVLAALALPTSCSPWAGVPLALTAIIVSVIARRKIQDQPDLFHGEKTAKTAFAMGVIGLMISGLTLVIVFATRMTGSQ